ncbi:hypothetical protein QBC41DRAFT_344678 [Cercophora samala]|uniref:RING-type domain-containing protein n=1 Tax=Cercophora samala TaxID=330535 RepID=A0AA39ZI20_9PEZI|nr:hypothetical protein QBC41DRAFT_344678 [Cercophora samala]
MAPQTYDCQICLSPFISPLRPLPPPPIPACGHHHCPRCLLENLTQSLKSLPFKPPTCCTPTAFIPPSVFRRLPAAIPRDTILSYRQKLTEYQSSLTTTTTPPPRIQRQQPLPAPPMQGGRLGMRIVFHAGQMPLEFKLPTYCHDTKCGAFIPDILGGRCRRCRKRTCEVCKTGFHLGEGGCKKEDVDSAEERTEMRRVAAMGLGKGSEEKKVKKNSERELWVLTRELMKKMEWKRCPRCKSGVEKVDGCNHITCVCGVEWCYRCEKLWGIGHRIGVGACAG